MSSALLVVAIATLKECASLTTTTGAHGGSRMLESLRTTHGGGRRLVMRREAETDAQKPTTKTEAQERTEATTNPLLRAAWSATEAFGAAFGAGAKEDGGGSAPASKAELVERVAADYAESTPYFLGGPTFDSAIYDDDCEFADPFVSFTGRDRFQANLGNLGSFITEASARALGNATITDTTYAQKFLVKLRLALPWSPVLSWPWGVTHVFDDENLLVTKHLEAWDVSPADGLRQLLTPGKDKVVS